MTARPLVLALFSVAACGRTPGTAATSQALAEVTSCRECHEQIVESYVQTAHFNTSAEPSATTIRGPFAEGRNVLQTRNEDISFTMEQKRDGFYQTARDSRQNQSRSERFGVVIGSGRKGQSYLYWTQGVLVQLPVSWLAGVDQWINSPGYPDGRVDFERVVPPRCLECHSTSFRLETNESGARWAKDYQLGISCSKCHGDGRQHVEYHTTHRGDSTAQSVFNPASVPRDQQLDHCAVCHGGALRIRQPPFSYQPGEDFDDFFDRPSPTDSATPDVHGNQVALLRRSRCFTASPAMTCSTCHDVHRPERDLVAMANKCLACHEAAAHPDAGQLGDRLMTRCIDCHMPNRPSDGLRLTTPSAQAAIFYRSHAIGIYSESETSVPGSGTR
jgi:hypothetical protein